MHHWDVIVVGAGAAGLLAAARAAELGRRALLLEKNPRPGVKILMSGGTRCNLTHQATAREIVEAFGRPGKFLHSALAELAPQGVVDLIEAEGVATKVEAHGKIFPASDRAADVLHALLRIAERSGVQWALNEPARRLSRSPDGRFRITTSRRTLEAERLIVTTGGQSYPACGTSGDAYAWMAAWGHRLATPRPALTPIRVADAWPRSLRGVSLPDVAVRVIASGESRPLAARRGAVLFAHFGLSGPAVLDVSRAVSLAARPGDLKIQCNFVPAQSSESLRQDWRQAAQRDGRRTVLQHLSLLVPRRLAEALLAICQTPSLRRLAEWSQSEQSAMQEAMQACQLSVTGVLGFSKAEVTAGGVDLKDVDSRTMESRQVAGLYLGRRTARPGRTHRRLQFPSSLQHRRTGRPRGRRSQRDDPLCDAVAGVARCRKMSPQAPSQEFLRPRSRCCPQGRPPAD